MPVSVERTGETYDAATMERWNVVNRILSADDFDADVLAFTAQLAAGPTRRTCFAISSTAASPRGSPIRQGSPPGCSRPKTCTAAWCHSSKTVPESNLPRPLTPPTVYHVGGESCHSTRDISTVKCQFAEASW
jgi:enoyl-CoA hydratase/carnithine racemase